MFVLGSVTYRIVDNIIRWEMSIQVEARKWICSLCLREYKYSEDGIEQFGQMNINDVSGNIIFR